VDELALGRLGAPHGVEGRIRLVSFSGENEHLLELSQATLKGGGRTMSVRIESVKEFGDGALLKIAGYDAPETARSLAGMELWAPREMAAPLYEDEYYYADLVGCELVFDEHVVARVIAVCDGGGSDLLEVEKSDGVSAYVPFRKEFIGLVDIKARRLELIAPWILE
jgi:16S rRNA processing protein RimM